MNIKFPPSFTEEQRRQFIEWALQRPPKIIEMIERFPPFGAYRLSGDTQDFYTPISYIENGTMRMRRWANDTFRHMWDVFGMDPSRLEPHPDADNFIEHVTRLT